MGPIDFPEGAKRRIAHKSATWIQKFHWNVIGQNRPCFIHAHSSKHRTMPSLIIFSYQRGLFAAFKCHWSDSSFPIDDNAFFMLFLHNKILIGEHKCRTLLWVWEINGVFLTTPMRACLFTDTCTSRTSFDRSYIIVWALEGVSEFIGTPVSLITLLENHLNSTDMFIDCTTQLWWIDCWEFVWKVMYVAKVRIRIETWWTMQNNQCRRTEENVTRKSVNR